MNDCQAAYLITLLGVMVVTAWLTVLFFIRGRCK